MSPRVSRRVGWSLVSVTRSVDLLSVVRDRRTTVMVDWEGLSVRLDLSLSYRSSILWTFPTFSSVRGVYMSVVVFLCS